MKFYNNQYLEVIFFFNFILIIVHIFHYFNTFNFLFIFIQMLKCQKINNKRNFIKNYYIKIKNYVIFYFYEYLFYNMLYS